MAKTTDKKSATKPASTAASIKKTSNSDAKGRVVLGPRYANKMFRVSEQPDGNVLLEPVVTVHEREVWLFNNPEALQMVRQGIRESQEGKGTYVGSFADYADLDVDLEQGD